MIPVFLVSHVQKIHTRTIHPTRTVISAYLEQELTEQLVGTSGNTAVCVIVERSTIFEKHKFLPQSMTK